MDNNDSFEDLEAIPPELRTKPSRKDEENHTERIEPLTVLGRKRFRVSITQKLHYTVDVLAKDADEARDLILEIEDLGEPECSYSDVEEVVEVPETDKTFCPSGQLDQEQREIKADAERLLLGHDTPAFREKSDRTHDA